MKEKLIIYITPKEKKALKILSLKENTSMTHFLINLLYKNYDIDKIVEKMDDILKEVEL